MLHVVKHPLIEHKLTYLRSKETSKKQFWELINEISMLLMYEATRDLLTEPKKVTTPLTETVGHIISGKKLVLAPILRAGLGMMEGMLKLVPSARVAHIGIYRDEENNSKPVVYYFKIPKHSISERQWFVIDPMLATGGSINAAIDMLKAEGAKDIKVITIISAPQGIDIVRRTHRDVTIITAAVDSGLNDMNYIMPGLGDAGDRLFGTK